jgi:hypothetical protein
VYPWYSQSLVMHMTPWLFFCSASYRTTLDCIYGFTSRSRIFHVYGDVTIAGEGLQNLDLCSALWAFEQGGIFNVPHLLWQETSIFPVSSEGPPHLVASYDTRRGMEDRSILSQILTGWITIYGKGELDFRMIPADNRCSIWDLTSSIIAGGILLHLCLKVVSSDSLIWCFTLVMCPIQCVSIWCRECKTNTIPILMHEMCISITLISSVVLRPKKLKSGK